MLLPPLTVEQEGARPRHLGAWGAVPAAAEQGVMLFPLLVYCKFFCFFFFPAKMGVSEFWHGYRCEALRRQERSDGGWWSGTDSARSTSVCHLGSGVLKKGCPASLGQK